ncbi:ISPpu9, transposase, partial [mine drainage metagenome]
MNASKRKRQKKRDLVVIHPHAAGIDVGSKFHVVAVPGSCDPEPVRSFRSFTGDLHRLADWLQQVGITSVAMESTSVYWIPVFEILEERGFEVILV